MIRTLHGKKPVISEDAWVIDSADIIGEVTIASGCTVWSNVSIRGDIAPITLGEGTNVQDNTVIHVDKTAPTTVGNHVTLGHSTVIHGCTIGDNCLIGMGAILLNNSVIGENCLVGAGALVTAGKQFPPNSLIVGSPARVVRTLDENELEYIRKNAAEYQRLGEEYKTGLANQAD
ncbi:MAG: gamma carbonic anhydrase family protein [Spirochaetota bacterium]